MLLNEGHLKLGRALVAGGTLTREEVQRELTRSGKRDAPLGKALLACGFPSEMDLYERLLAGYRIPRLNPKTTKVPMAVVKMVREDVARRLQVLPLDRVGDILCVAASDVSNLDGIHELRELTGCKVVCLQADPDSLGEAINTHYRQLRMAQSSVMLMTESELKGYDVRPGAPAPAGAADEPAVPIPAAPLAALPARGPALTTGYVDEIADDWFFRYASAGPVPVEPVPM